MARHGRELVRGVGLEAHRPRERASFLACVEPVGHLQQLSNASVHLREQERLGRRLEQTVEQFGRLLRTALAERVEERPGGTRHCLGDERGHVRGRCLGAVGMEERELLELTHRQLALVAPVDVGFAHQCPDTPRQLRAGADAELHAAFACPVGDPAGHRGGTRGREALREELAGSLQGSRFLRLVPKTAE